MTINEFKDLDELEQVEVLWYDAVRISQREDEIYKYEFYSHANFYIETKLHKEQDAPHGLRAFLSNSEYMSPYINQVDIKGLTL